MDKTRTQPKQQIHTGSGGPASAPCPSSRSPQSRRRRLRRRRPLRLPVPVSAHGHRRAHARHTHAHLPAPQPPLPGRHSRQAAAPRRTARLEGASQQPWHLLSLPHRDTVRVRHPGGVAQYRGKAHTFPRLLGALSWGLFLARCRRPPARCCWRGHVPLLRLKVTPPVIPVTVAVRHLRVRVCAVVVPLVAGAVVLCAQQGAAQRLGRTYAQTDAAPDGRHDVIYTPSEVCAMESRCERRELQQQHRRKSSATRTYDVFLSPALGHGRERHSARCPSCDSARA